MANFTDIPQRSFLKGLNASVNRFIQPKGSVPQLSNLLVSPRGSLLTCDGSASVNLYNGAVTTGRGRFESQALFSPIGVQPYYLVIAKALDMPLGAPQNLTIADGGAGSLSGGTYYYVVTALDGEGGETTKSNEVTINIAANHCNILTWNVVPNAYGYNVYRSRLSGQETLMIGTGLPIIQPDPITATVTFTDNLDSPFPVYTLTHWSLSHPSGHGTIWSFSTLGPNIVQAGESVVVAGTTIDGNYTINVKLGSTGLEQTFGLPVGVPQSGTGGTLTGGGTSPPIVDTTVQVVIFLMPNGTIPVPYTNANIVAKFPASPNSFGPIPSGGTGGQGGIGAGIPGQQQSTVSGGIVGMTSLIPQMVQFTNRMAIALGNGFNPQIFWDSSGTVINPAPTAAVTSATVDAFGVVTIVTPAVLSTTDPLSAAFMPPGSNVILVGITNTLYNGTFVVTSVNNGGGTFTVQNTAAIGQAPSSGGTWTDTTTPIVNTFVPAYPSWTADSLYGKNSIVQPSTPNGFYFQAVQGGISDKTTEPVWPTTIGQQISDGTIIWVNVGTTQSAAPAPPGAGHIIVYAGSLWVWNTWPLDTTDGLDGPDTLRMSGVNNPFSWNPINQAFLDKDDGTDGMGLATFTISAEGIPPEGSLVAFKDYAGYQIVGVFGSTDFSIQRIRSDMGCTAPRSIYFVPGFGIVRYTHLGVANFGGVQDTIISEELRPYLFPQNTTLANDITPVDANYIGLGCSALTTNPPMYCLLMPIGASNGVLTRAFTYDLVLRSWCIVDFPFQLSTIYQARAETSNPITLLGGFQDGQLQRWQAGDELWSNGNLVAWQVRTPEVAAQGINDRIYLRRLFVRGTNAAMTSTNFTTPTAQLRFNRLDAASLTTLMRLLPAGSTGTEFQLDIGIGRVVTSVDCLLSGSGRVELDSFDWMTMRKPTGIPVTVA